MDQEHAAWKRAAFVGWQTASVFGGKIGPFKKYLKNMGLAPTEEKLTPDEMQREKTRAFANAERVRRAFDGG